MWVSASPISIAFANSCRPEGLVRWARWGHACCSLSLHRCTSALLSFMTSNSQSPGFIGLQSLAGEDPSSAVVLSCKGSWAQWLLGWIPGAAPSASPQLCSRLLFVLPALCLAVPRNFRLLEELEKVSVASASALHSPAACKWYQAALKPAFLSNPCRARKALVMAPSAMAWITRTTC